MLMTTEDVRRVAANPDEATERELRDLFEYIGDGSQPGPQAAALWPDKPAAERLRAAIWIRQYANVRRSALVLDERGETDRARQELARCDEIYSLLPFWAIW
jgi:hypothetical protein